MFSSTPQVTPICVKQCHLGKMQARGHIMRASKDNSSKFTKYNFMQSHFEYDFSSEMSRRIAQEFIKKMKTKRKVYREVPTFADTVRNEVLYLHEYNLTVFKVTQLYPFSEEYTQFLMQYVLLECKILYKREYYSKNRENQTQDRVIRLLLNVYNDYFESKQFKRREITERSMKSIIEIFVKIRTQHNLKYIILENMTVSLLKKNGHFEKIDALRDKPLPFLLDSILSPDKSLSIYRNASTSDYGTDDGLSNISQTLNGDHNYELSPTLEDDVDGIKDECRAISDTQEKDVNKNSKYVYTICLDESGLDSDEEIVFFEKEIEGKKKRRIKNSNMVTTKLTLNQKPPTSKNYQSGNTIKSTYNENDVSRINDGDKLLQEINSYLTDYNSDCDKKSVLASFRCEEIIDISDDSTTSELPTIKTSDERKDFALTILSNSSQQNENQMEIIEPATNKNAEEGTTMSSHSSQQIENQIEILDIDEDTELLPDEINNRQCNKSEPNDLGIIDKAYVADSSQIISMDSTDPFIKTNKCNESDYDLGAVSSSGHLSSSCEDDSLCKITSNDASKQGYKEHREICPKEIKINLYQCTLSDFDHFFIEGKSTDTECTLKNIAKVALEKKINATEFDALYTTKPDVLTEVLIINNKKTVLDKDANNLNYLLAKEANTNDGTKKTLHNIETSNKTPPRRYSLRSHEDFEEKHLTSANAEELDLQIQKKFAVDNQKNELVQIPPNVESTGDDEGSNIYNEDIISQNLSKVDKLKILEIDDHAKDTESGVSVVKNKSGVILVTFGEEKLSQTESIEISAEDRHENKPTTNEKIVQTINVDAVFEKTVTNESQNLEIESSTFESKQITSTDTKGEEEQFQVASDDQTENKETTINSGVDVNEVVTNKEEEETSTISQTEDKQKINENIETVTEIVRDITETEIRGRTLTTAEEISQSLYTGNDQTENDEVIININEKVIEVVTNEIEPIKVSGLNQYEDIIATNEMIETVTEIGEQINEIDTYIDDKSHTKEEEISQIRDTADNQININYDEEIFQDEHTDEVPKIDENEESVISFDTKFIEENKNVGILTKDHSPKIPKFEEKIETLPFEIRSVELSKDVEVTLGTNVANKREGEIATECSVANETISHIEHMEMERTVILEEINIEIPDSVDNMLAMQTLLNNNEEEKDIHNVFITENKLVTVEPTLQDRGGQTEEVIIEETCTENKDEMCIIQYEGVKTEGVAEETCIGNEGDTSKIKDVAFDKEQEGKSETLVLDCTAINKEPTQNEGKTSTERKILDTQKNENEQHNSESIEIVEGNDNNIDNKKIGNEELRIILVDIEQSTSNVINKTSSIENDLGIQIEQVVAENIKEPKNKLAIVDTNIECSVEDEKRIENKRLLKNNDELQVGRHVYQQKQDNLEEISQYATNSIETSHEYSFYKSPFINEVIVEAPVIEEEICFEIPKAVTHYKDSCFFEQEVEKNANSEDVEKTKIVVSEETKTNLLEPGIINSIINNKELLLNDTNKLEDCKSFSISNFDETRENISKESFGAPYDSTHPDWNIHKDKILNEEHFEDLHLLASVTVEIKQKSETPKSKRKRKHVKTTNSKKESANAKNENVKNILRKKIDSAETIDEKRMTRSAYRKNIFENIMKPQEFKTTLPINNVKIHQLPDYLTNKDTTDSDSNDSEFNKLFIDDNEVIYNEDTDEENHVFNYKPRIFCKNTKVTTKIINNKKPKTKAAIKSYENNLNPYVSIMRLEEKEDTVANTEIVFPNNEYTVNEVALEKEIVNKKSLLADVNLPIYIPPKLRYKLSCKNTVKFTTEKLVQRLKKEGTDITEMQEVEQICEKDMKQTIVETENKADITVKSQINEIPISKKIKILSDVIIAPKRNNHTKMLEIVGALEINNSKNDNKIDQPREMSDNDDIEVIKSKKFCILNDTVSKIANSIKETPESFAEPKKNSSEDSIDVKEEISMKKSEIPIKNEKQIDYIKNETKEIGLETSKQSKDEIKGTRTKKNKETKQDTKNGILVKERIESMTKDVTFIKGDFIKDKNHSKRKSKDVEETVCMKKFKTDLHSKEIEENKKDRADKKLRNKTASMNKQRTTTNSTKNINKVSKEARTPKKDITKFRKDVGSDEVESTEFKSITSNTKEIKESVKVSTSVNFLLQEKEIDELIDKYNTYTKKTSRSSRRSSYLETHLDNKLEVDKKCVIVSTKMFNNIPPSTTLRTSRNSRSKSYTEETETVAESVESKLRSKSISIAECQKLISEVGSKRKVDKNKTPKSCSSVFKSKKDVIENKRVLRTKIEDKEIKSPSKLSKVLKTKKSPEKEKIQLDLVQSDTQQKIISSTKIPQIINENEDEDRISEEIYQKVSTSISEQKLQNTATTEKSNQANIENLEETEDKKSNVASDLQEMASNVVNENAIDKSYEDKNAKITNFSEEIAEKLLTNDVEEYLEEKIITEKENQRSVEENGDKSMNITSIDTLSDEIMHKKIIKDTKDLQNEITNETSYETSMNLIEENLGGKLKPVIISEEIIYKEATNIVQEHLQNISEEIIHKESVNDLEVDLQNEITNEKSHETSIDLMEENLDGKVRSVIISEEIIHKEVTGIVQERLQNISEEIIHKEPVKDLEVDSQNEITNKKSHETRIDLMEESLDGKVRPVNISEEIIHKEVTGIVQERLQNISEEIIHKEPVKDLEVDSQNEITNKKSHETRIDLMEESLDGKVRPVIIYKEATNIVQGHLQNISEEIIHKEPVKDFEVDLQNEITNEKSHETRLDLTEENLDGKVRPVIIFEENIHKEATNIVQEHLQNISEEIIHKESVNDLEVDLQNEITNEKSHETRLDLTEENLDGKVRPVIIFEENIHKEATNIVQEHLQNISEEIIHKESVNDLEVDLQNEITNEKSHETSIDLMEENLDGKVRSVIISEEIIHKEVTGIVQERLQNISEEIIHKEPVKDLEVDSQNEITNKKSHETRIDLMEESLDGKVRPVNISEEIIHKEVTGIVQERLQNISEEIIHKEPVKDLEVDSQNEITNKKSHETRIDLMEESLDGKVRPVIIYKEATNIVQGHLQNISEEIIHKEPVKDFEVDLQNEITNEKSHETRLDLTEENLDGKVRPVIIFEENIHKEATNIVQEHLQNISEEIIHKESVNDLEVDLQNEITNEKSHETRLDLTEENLDGKVRPVIIFEENIHKEATNIVQEHLQNISEEIIHKESVNDLEVDLQNEITNEKSHETRLDLTEENLDGKVRPVIIFEENIHKEATNIVQEHLQNISEEIIHKDKELTNVVEVDLHNEITTKKSHQTSIVKVEENLDENAKYVNISEVILYKEATNIVRDFQLKKSNLLNECIVTEKELDTISLKLENAPKAIIKEPMKSSKEIYEETNDKIKQTGTENNNVTNETKKLLTKMGDISTKQFYGTITTNAGDNLLSSNLDGLNKVEEQNLVQVTHKQLKELSNCRKYDNREKIKKLSSGIRHTIKKRPRKYRHNVNKILGLAKLDGIDVSKIMSNKSKTINGEYLPSNLKKYQNDVSDESINCLPTSQEKLIDTYNEILDQKNACSVIGNYVPVKLHKSEITHQELDITEADNVIAEEIIVESFRLENENQELHENQLAIEETVEEFKVDASENVETFKPFDIHVLNDTSDAVSPKKAASQNLVILESDKNSEDLLEDTIMEKPQNNKEKSKEREEELTVILNDLVIKQKHADVIHDTEELRNIPISRAASFEVFKNEQNKIDNVEEKLTIATALEDAIFKTEDNDLKDMSQYKVNETKANHNTSFAIDPIQGDKNINENKLEPVPITDVSFDNGKNKNGKTELLEESKFVDIKKLKYSSVIEDSTLKSNQNMKDYIKNDKETIIENLATDQNQENTIIDKENPKIKSAYEVTINEETIKDETSKQSLSETLEKNTINQTKFKEDNKKQSIQEILQLEHKETDFDILTESGVPETSLEYNLASEALNKSLVCYNRQLPKKEMQQNVNKFDLMEYYKNSVDISQNNENSTDQELVGQGSFETSPVDSMAALDSKLKIQGDKEYAEISNKSNNAEYLCSTDKHTVFEGTTPKLQEGNTKCSTVLETPDLDRILVPFLNNQDFASPELKNNMEEPIVKPKIRTVVVDEDLHKPGTSRQLELVDNLAKQVHPVELQKLQNQPQENLQNPATIEEIMENRLHFENQFYLPQGNQLSSSTQMRVLDGTNDHNYSYWDCPSDPVMSIAEDGGEMSLNAKEFGNVILNFGNENEFLDFTSSLLDLDLPDENTSRRESEPFTSWDNEPKVIVVLNEQYSNQPSDTPVVIIGDISDCTVSEPWGQQDSGNSQQPFHDGSIDLFSQKDGPGNPILAEEITVPTSECLDTNIKIASEISKLYNNLNITSDTVSVDESRLESICNDKQEEINQNLCIGESSSEKPDNNSDSSNSRNSSASESSGKSKKVVQQLALYKKIQAKRSSQNHMKCNNLEIPSRKCVRASPRNWTKLSSLPPTKLNESPKLNEAEKLEIDSPNKPINNITPPVVDSPSDLKNMEPVTDGMDIKELLITEKKIVMKHPTTSISNKVISKNETSTPVVFTDVKEIDKKDVTTRKTTNVKIDKWRQTPQPSEIDCKNSSSLETKIFTKTKSIGCSKTENSHSKKLPSSKALKVSKSLTNDLIQSVTYPIISKTSINRVQEKTTTNLKRYSNHQESEISLRDTNHQESEISLRDKNHESTSTAQHRRTLEISQQSNDRSSDLSYSRLSSLSPNDSERSSRDRSSRGGSETSSFGYDDVEVTSNLYDTVKSRKRAVTKRDSSVESKSRYDYKTSRNKRKKSPDNYKILKKSKISGNDEEKEIQERISIANNLKVKIRLDGTVPYPMHCNASGNQNSFSSSYTVDNILKQKEPAKDISRDNFQDWDRRNAAESGSKSKNQKPYRSNEDAAFDHLISQGNINPCFTYNPNQATSNSTKSDRPDLSQHSYKRYSDRSSVDLNYSSKRRPEEQSNIRKSDRCRRSESSQRNPNFRTSTELNRSQQGQRPSTEYYHKYPPNYPSRDREGSYIYRKSSSSSRQSQQFSSHGSSNSNVTNAYRRNEEHKKHKPADTPLYTTNSILTDEKKNEIWEDLRNVVEIQKNKSSKSNSEVDWYRGIEPLISENPHGFNKRE